MDEVMTALVRELKALRKGRGIHAPQISEHVGPALRAICDAAEDAGTTELRNKLATLLRRLATELSDDLKVAVHAAFALDDQVRTQFYQERVRWAAGQLNRDERTARRRIDEGIVRIAELAATRYRVTGSTARTVPGSSWHTEELRVALTLDQPEPEALEFRRIVVDRAELNELDLALTLTSPTGQAQPAGFDVLRADVVYGGRLVSRTRESTDRFGFVLALSRTLRHNERHEFMLRFRVPRGWVMQPHYVCVPKHRCDLFDLHVRFDPEALPRRIWRLTDNFQRDVEDPLSGDTRISTDEAGEIHIQFRDLMPGMAYGVRWDAPSAATAGAGQADA